MNTKQNQQIWIEKIHNNLKLRGRSKNTFINYKSSLNKFFNFFNETTNIEKLSEEDIISFLNNCYLKKIEVNIHTMLLLLQLNFYI